MTAASFSVEGELLNLLRAGDDEAYAHVVRKHTGRLQALARGFLGNEDDAADAVQDAYLSMCRSMVRFEGNSSVATWLHRIVVNNCLMKLRSKSRRKSYSIDELLLGFDDTGHRSKPISAWTESSRDSLADDEARRQVRTCIDKLPEDYRTVLVLRDIEDFDTEQTAAILGVNPGAVKTRLHRARQALRTLLVPYMERGCARISDAFAKGAGAARHLDASPRRKRGIGPCNLSSPPSSNKPEAFVKSDSLDGPTRSGASRPEAGLLPQDNTRMEHEHA